MNEIYKALHSALRYFKESQLFWNWGCSFIGVLFKGFRTRWNRIRWLYWPKYNHLVYLNLKYTISAFILVSKTTTNSKTLKRSYPVTLFHLKICCPSLKDTLSSQSQLRVEVVSFSFFISTCILCFALMEKTINSYTKQIRLVYWSYTS